MLRPATDADAEAIADLVDAAYGPYVERIGMRPGPMDEDYREVIRDRQVTVAESGFHSATVPSQAGMRSGATNALDSMVTG